MTPGKKKYHPEYSAMYDTAVRSMDGRPKDPRRESAEQIVDVFPSRDCGGTKENRYSDFRGRVSGLKLGSLSRKEWDKMRLDEDMDNLHSAAKKRERGQLKEASGEGAGRK